MHVREVHHAAGCNRSSQALAWGASGLVAYASHHTVVVYDPQAERVLTTLLGHSGDVRCVLWLPLPDQDLLCSGACDGTLRLWRLIRGAEGAVHGGESLGSLPCASTPISSLAAWHAAGEGLLLLVASSADSAACTWSLTLQHSTVDPGSPLPAEPQRLHTGQPMVHSVAVTHGPPGTEDWALLALGGVDCTVSVYTRAPGATFLPAAKLRGHTDWVRGLAWVHLPGSAGRTLLASASQDRYVRVWALASPGSVAAAGAGVPGAEAALTRFAPRPRIVLGAAIVLEATLEALLVGHEDWVLSVAWQPRGAGAGAELPCLLTASMDRTMMLWRPDPSGLWLSVAALGDAGANHLGYYTGVWSPDGAGAATHGYTGSLHLWRRRAARDEGGWDPVPAPTGHMGAVVDAGWAGPCLLTVSEDQTTRCWARCTEGGRWRELARPQVHGHDFFGLAVVPQGGAGGGQAPAPAGADDTGADGAAPPPAPPICFASCSEEKVIRVFTAPHAFQATLRTLCGGAGEGVADSGEWERAGRERALGAALPALGLSNKAVFEDEDEAGEQARGGGGAPLAATGAASYAEGPDCAPNAAPRALRTAPLEEQLAQSTLWPEVRKLYGHGNEVATLAGDPLGRYLASASLASGSAATAAIWLWDAAARWAPAGRLAAHTLTVTRLAFSPDGTRLASVSRDRTLALWRRGGAAPQGADAPPFALETRCKAASRVLWDVAWAPDGQTLATGSRDGAISLWSAPPEAPGQEPLRRLRELACGAAVRALAFCPADAGLLAVGLDSGELRLLRLGPDPALVWRRDAHAGPLRRLAWRQHAPGDADFILASVASDGAVRLWAVPRDP